MTEDACVCVCLTCKPKASSACGLSKVRNYVTPTAAAAAAVTASAADSAAFRVHFVRLLFKPSATRFLQPVSSSSNNNNTYTHARTTNLILMSSSLATLQQQAVHAWHQAPSTVINSAQLNPQ